jgi:major capsid protein
MKLDITQRGEIVTNVMGEDGDPIVLNAQESYEVMRLARQYAELAPGMKEFSNALGYEVSITTLYAISKRVVDQKFATIPPADYMPLRVGDNAWSDNILTYRSYALGADFESGLVNTGGGNARIADADAGIDSLVNPVINWWKQVNWTIFDLKLAARSGNWDIVTAKEVARKTNWDLGIQRIAFLGSTTIPTVLGLLTQAGITTNTSLIPANISTMTATQFNSFVQGLIGAYRLNANYTAMPNRFVIPEQDYDGLMVPIPGTLGTFPVPMITYLEDAFKRATGNQDFKIMRCFYCDKANNSTVSGLNTNIYALYNSNEDSLRMDIPVDYTSMVQNTINGAQFTSVAVGQFTGPLAYRPLEMLYFTHS